MNIRRFVATDMREALSAIRADLGADAVMLSSRKLPQGVEVIAAIDYDDSLLAGSASRSMSAMDSSATADADDTHVDARDSAALADYERVAAGHEHISVAPSIGATLRRCRLVDDCESAIIGREYRYRRELRRLGVSVGRLRQIDIRGEPTAIVHLDVSRQRPVGYNVFGGSPAQVVRWPDPPRGGVLILVRHRAPTSGEGGRIDARGIVAAVSEGFQGARTAIGGQPPTASLFVRCRT